MRAVCCLFGLISAQEWPCPSVVLMSAIGRAGNSGGTREPSSQKEFGLAESFFALRYIQN